LRIPGEPQTAVVAGFRLVWFSPDRLAALFALVFAIIALLGVLYGAHRMRHSEAAFALIYAGAAISTVFAGDWITFFVFWEVMAVASLGLVWRGDTTAARRAGMRYLLVHAAGGSLLFVGIALHLGAGAGQEPSRRGADNATANDDHVHERSRVRERGLNPRSGGRTARILSGPAPPSAACKRGCRQESAWR